MKWEKNWRNVWLAIIGMIIANNGMMRMPLAMAYFAALILLEKDVKMVYISILAVLGLTGNVWNLLQGGVLMLLMCVLRGKAFLTMGEKRVHIIAAFYFSVSFLVENLKVYLTENNALGSNGVGDIMFASIFEKGILLNTVLETVLTCALSILYCKAISILEKDYAKVTTDNKATMAVLILGVTVFAGLPVSLFHTFIIAEAVSLFAVLFVIYKFGFGLGITGTVVLGAIMSFKMEDMHYMTDWLFVGIASYGLYLLLKGRRLCFLSLFVGIYVGIGALFDPMLLHENSIKAIVTAAVLFMFAPATWLLPIDEQIRKDEFGGVSKEWGNLLLRRMEHMADAFKRVQYVLVGNENAGIGFCDVGNLIESFTKEIEQVVPMRKTAEAEIIYALSNKGVQLKDMMMVKNKDEHYDIYLTARVKRGRMLEANAVRKIVEDKLKMKLVLTEESRNIVSYNYDLICMRERPHFVCKTAIKRMSRYEEEVSGDNFYVGDIGEGKLLCLIADGMGNGKRAAFESEALVDTLWELLSAGIDYDMSIRIVNAYLAGRNKGETFTTLDMILLDLYTGTGRIYKQGAATTYIKRKDWLEMIKSTSLPVGVMEEAVCEKCVKKFFDQDLIIMVSDGVLESMIYENKDEYMQDMLNQIDSTEPSDVAEELKNQIIALSGTRLQDDATILVCKLVKTL